MSMRPLLRLLLCLLAPLVAGRDAEAQQDQRCLFEIDFIGDTGRVVTPPGTTQVNYYAGGGVRFSCRGTAVRMSADSVASIDGGRVVYFVGKVRYRDSTVTLDADQGTYYKDGERWEARGRVKTANLRSGSTLTGPSVDYYRPVVGLRDTTEVVAVGRTTVRYLAKNDSSAKGAATAAVPAAEPYVITSDRLRMRGDERIWAAGAVTVRRSDLDAAADSMALDTSGGWQEGVLIGRRPRFKAMARDTFELLGGRIDFGMDRRELRVVTAIGQAEAISAERTLTGHVIRLHLRDRAPRRSIAWSRSVRATADGPAYAAKGDSLTFFSPDEALTQVVASGHGWVGARVDSVSRERDWISGDTVVAFFRQLNDETSLRQLIAERDAKAYYRGAGDGKAAGSLAYVRGDRITVTMQKDRDDVETVDVRGHVDGVRLEPKTAGSTGLPPIAAPPGRPS